jgi:hypothetical protein
MATNINKIPENITEYPNSFKRQGCFPLEAYSVFYSLTDAEAYAKDNPIAYVGQILAVIDENEAKAYIIKDTTGLLEEIASGDIKLNIENGTGNYSLVTSRAA